MRNYSMQQLAFIGDAIHTAFVRSYVIKNNDLKLNELNKLASKFCNARKQSSVIQNILPSLSDEEGNIVRMARNSKAKHMAKNADPADYHRATSFEALVGWLYLTEQTNRLNEILSLSIQEKE